MEQTNNGVTASQRRMPWLGVASALLIVIGLIAVWVSRSSDSVSDTKFCAGVGLVSDQTYPSADAAFTAWLLVSPEQPPAQDWEWERGDVDVHFVNETYHDGADGFGHMSVSIGERDASGNPTPGRWSLQEACVGPADL